MFSLWVITLRAQSFHDPVLAEDGLTYERAHITAYIRQHGVSPITGETLQLDSLWVNQAVVAQIDEYLLHAISLNYCHLLDKDFTYVIQQAEFERCLARNRYYQSTGTERPSRDASPVPPPTYRRCAYESASLYIWSLHTARALTNTIFPAGSDIHT